MDDKTRTLLKKHIRMLDYIRADLVAMLGHPPENPDTVPRPIDIYDKPPVSPLYASFEAAKVTDGEGRHVDDCPCSGCVYVRSIKPGIAPLIREGSEICRWCRFPPAECVCGTHLPKHATANVHPDTGRLLPVIDGEAHFPLHGAAVDLFAPLMQEITAAGFVMHDGPKMAYFSTDAHGQVVPHGEGTRYDYHEVKVKGADRDAVLDDFATLIRNYLALQTGKAIRWRVWPELSYEGDHVQGGTRWCAYARLVVVPA